MIVKDIPESGNGGSDKFLYSGCLVYSLVVWCDVLSSALKAASHGFPMGQRFISISHFLHTV